MRECFATISKNRSSKVSVNSDQVFRKAILRNELSGIDVFVDTMGEN